MTECYYVNFNVNAPLFCLKHSALLIVKLFWLVTAVLVCKKKCKKFNSKQCHGFNREAPIFVDKSRRVMNSK